MLQQQTLSVQMYSLTLIGFVEDDSQQTQEQKLHRQYVVSKKKSEPLYLLKTKKQWNIALIISMLQSCKPAIKSRKICFISVHLKAVEAKLVSVWMFGYMTFIFIALKLNLSKYLNNCFNVSLFLNFLRQIVSPLVSCQEFRIS